MTDEIKNGMLSESKVQRGKFECNRCGRRYTRATFFNFDGETLCYSCAIKRYQAKKRLIDMIDKAAE